MYIYEITSYPQPPTHPTNVAWDRLHQGLVCGRLAIAPRSTLYTCNWRDSNLDCSEAIMWEGLSLVCGQLWIINQRIINNAVVANSASASRLACKQKEDILNIFFN